jgi:hypothetical protein
MADKHLRKTDASLSENKNPVGSPADIREHVEVYTSCGTMVRTVDHVLGRGRGSRMKLRYPY